VRVTKKPVSCIEGDLIEQTSSKMILQIKSLLSAPGQTSLKKATGQTVHLNTQNVLYLGTD
jgi:hypothetical protein